MSGFLLYAGYLLGTFKIVEVVERWPNGRIWAILGFAWVMGHLALMAGAWSVMAGVT